MAEENGNVSDLTIEVLKGIRADLQGLRGEVKQGFAEVRGEIQQLKVGLNETNEKLQETNEKLQETNEKLQQLTDYTQTGFKALLTQGDRRFLDHEGRLRRLEEHAGLDPTR